MYLEIFLADFVVFRVFLGISRDFAEIPEFRGSATARNIRSPVKCCRPRTSDTAIWASLIVAGPYFLALLPGACHLVSCCVAQQLDSNNSVDLPPGPSVVADIISIAT